MGKSSCAYLDFIKSNQSGVKQKPKFIRQLYVLMKKMAPSLFIATVERALKYRVTNIEALMNISHQLMKKESHDFPEITVRNDYEERKAYQQGRFSQERAPEFYGDILKGKKDTQNNKEE